LITSHNINDFQSVNNSSIARKINQTAATAEFSYNLSFESWEDVFSGEDADMVFSCILYTL